MSGELWLAEGFTQYYGPIALSRAGLDDLTATVGDAWRSDPDGDDESRAARSDPLKT